MKVVTLCGSMRFAKQMQQIALELETRRGYCVMQPIFDANIILSEKDLDNLRKAHLKKIDIADSVYIVNIDGYIGQSVKREIAYAKAHGKEVNYHEKMINKGEKNGWQAI